MTEDQIQDAVRQVRVHCDLLMENYEMVSMRSALYTLGFDPDEADEVIQYCADHGFSYCLDPMIPAKSYPDFIEEYPVASVCYWGPDQLKSRLWGVCR